MPQRLHWRGELVRASRNEDVTLPKGAEWHGLGPLRLHLPADAVTANMQDDDAAFEGWLLALRAWCNLTRAELAWTPPTDTRDLHYQRFLYRVEHFRRLFGDWFAVATPDALEHSRLHPEGDYRLNVAGRPSKAPPQNEEARVERELAHGSRRSSMCARFRLDGVERQFPVGLFDGEPREDGEIFTRGKSAIDLVGWRADEKTFCLFELKVGDNRPMGAVSELFLYAMMLLDVWRGRFGFTRKKPGRGHEALPGFVRGAQRFEACLLAESFHPLLAQPARQQAVLELLTNACGRAGDPLTFSQATPPV